MSANQPEGTDMQFTKFISAGAITAGSSSVHDDLNLYFGIFNRVIGDTRSQSLAVQVPNTVGNHRTQTQARDSFKV